MIVLREQKVVIITPPKTGSTSLHARLCLQGEGIFVMGPQSTGDVIEKHTVSFPWEVQQDDYEIVVVVRNPYTRVLSLYGHAKKFGYQQSFPHFVEYTLCTQSYPFGQPINQMVQGVGVSNYLKLEHLEYVFEERWGIKLDLERLNKGPQGGLGEYNARAIELVQLHHHWDFVNYKYDKEFPGGSKKDKGSTGEGSQAGNQAATPQ